MQGFGLTRIGKDKIAAKWIFAKNSESRVEVQKNEIVLNVE